MKLERVGNTPFDATLPINIGILADEMVATTQGVRKRNGVINQAEFKRRAKTRTACAAAAPGSSRPENRPLHPTVERLTQRTVKFIRWLIWIWSATGTPPSPGSLKSKPNVGHC